MSFVNDVKNKINDRKQLTENGGVGYETSRSELVDFNFKIPSYRSAKPEVIMNDFVKAYYENPAYAVAYLFYARDIRGGLGERRLFRIAMEQLSYLDEDKFIQLLPLVAEYGRWDDIFAWVDISVNINDAIVEIVKTQLYDDLINYGHQKPISLLAKWLPTMNCHNAERKRKASWLIKELGVSPKHYRKWVTALRKYLDVVEVKISDNRWDEVDYSTVPSNANLKYSMAFYKHDEERRRDYLMKLASGDKSVKMNSSVLYPHDIVHSYRDYAYFKFKKYDEALEQMWKGLPDYVNNNGNTLVVVDGSGSMGCSIGGNKRALDVSQALGIYFSERSSGEFKDKFITFGRNPKLVDISDGKSLKDKLEIVASYEDYTNTNIEAVFQLILDVAIDEGYKQTDLPDNILIITDGEFDFMVDDADDAIFDNLKEQYERNGYKLPRLVFWNVNSRTNTIPLQENENGVALVSGFSVAICEMVLSGELDPYKVLIEAITKDKYRPILDIMSK